MVKLWLEHQSRSRACWSVGSLTVTSWLFSPLGSVLVSCRRQSAGMPVQIDARTHPRRVELVGWWDDARRLGDGPGGLQQPGGDFLAVGGGQRFQRRGELAGRAR
ncbi:hypothetical protein [Fodinicola feengrottensis]|uniref:hypothetical protein n=1 Tax=Fodinicola feengrottensis TaxID=435914 RepID=UPI0013D70957|nr:hypothetical protein [Fodinicola feengrottensis]